MVSKGLKQRDNLIFQHCPAHTKPQEDTEAAPGKIQNTTLYCSLPRGADKRPIRLPPALPAFMATELLPGVRLANAKIPTLPAVVFHAIVSQNLCPNGTLTRQALCGTETTLTPGRQQSKHRKTV